MNMTAGLQKLFRASAAWAFILVLTGCYPPQVQYQWGWATQRVTGTMTNEAGEPLAEPGFIVVRSYYSQFVELSPGQPLYFPQARLFFPDKQGRFNIPFDLKAVKLNLNFIAAGYVMQSISFKRQLGVGNFSYEAKMRHTAGWQDHLFVTVSPFLQQFILEQDFQMAQVHQLYLGDWLSEEKAANTPKL